MNAVYLVSRGDVPCIEVRPDPRPVPEPGQVLVRMRAASVNRVDLYMRDSGIGITHTLPQIMGVDGAGIVEEVGEGSPLSVGQAVVVHPGLACGKCEFCRRGDGVLCERIRILGEHCHGTMRTWLQVPETNVFPMPRELDFVQGAALGVNYLTAWRMVFTQAALRAGETVLIFGIGGGVSIAAMQLAKLAGARVIVTSRSQAKLDRARFEGADGGVRTDDPDFLRSIDALTGGRGVDVVFDNIGAKVWDLALRSLVRGGRLVLCGATTGSKPPADLQRIFVRQLKIFGSTLGNFGEFADLLRFVELHSIEPLIDSTHTVTQTHSALERMEADDRFGKVVVTFPA